MAEDVLKHMHFGSDFEAEKVTCWRRPVGQNEAPAEAPCYFPGKGLGPGFSLSGPGGLGAGGCFLRAGGLN